VENRGLWALEAPPKREKQMNTRGPIYRLAGHCVRTCVRTHQLFVVEHKAHVRPQITGVVARTDWACVQRATCVAPSALRTWQESASSLGAFCLLLAMF
jgi:hypothetical protein